jgi:HAD superfamily hydrolase (TIGR01509 family)
MAVGNALQAAVFDLDGVLTFTAHVHAAAWKQLFDEYLQSRQNRFGEPFRPFDLERDYRAFVDGKPRYQGVWSFLESRGVQLPYGTPADAPDQETICGLGNRKNLLFNEKIRELGVKVDDDAVRFVRELRDGGVKVGLASSSKNAEPILRQVNLVDLFQARVDGVVSEQLGLHGKPQPDIFLKCLDLLIPGSKSDHAMVVEDAISGVQAGRRGGFGLVLGIDRTGEADALREHGADWVVSSFREINRDQVMEYFRRKAA